MKILKRNYSRWSLLLLAMANPSPATIPRKNSEIENQTRDGRPPYAQLNKIPAKREKIL